MEGKEFELTINFTFVKLYYEACLEILLVTLVRAEEVTASRTAGKNRFWTFLIENSMVTRDMIKNVVIRHHFKLSC